METWIVIREGGLRQLFMNVCKRESKHQSRGTINKHSKLVFYKFSSRLFQIPSLVFVCSFQVFVISKGFLHFIFNIILQ